ncbi:putative DNA-binding protein [Pseudogracilibacillus sp. SO30301A]|uniref:putative DNA-binding protein n=1 Tax=Pseudogracilibacillus sp. SO30301A TaxID=3098291 RepID=UPI00300E2840
MLEKTTRINMLYDFYHLLLTDKQKDYMELYYREDYSLGEIASESNVSRQAVYDNIKRTEQLLETYEEKLKLYSKFQQRQNLLTELKEKSKQAKLSDQLAEIIDALQKID